MLVSSHTRNAAAGRRAALGLTAALALIACGGAPDAADVELAAGEVAVRILEGATDRRDDHFGHALAAPAIGFLIGGESAIAVGGGNPWVEVAEVRSRRRDAVGLFRGPAAARDGSEQAHLRIEGSEPNDRFGFALTFSEGLLGPAGTPGPRADLFVGAPRGPVEPPGVAEADGGLFSERGRVHLFAAGDFDGAPAGTSITALRARLTIGGDRRGERLGLSVAAPGDVDGDGIADLAAGAPGGSLWPAAPGRVLLLPGANLRALVAEGVREVVVDDPRLGARTLLEGGAGDALGTSLTPWPATADGKGAGLIAGAIQAHWSAALDGWDAGGPGYLVLWRADGSERGELRRLSADLVPGSQLGRSSAVLKTFSGPLVLAGAPFHGPREDHRPGAVLAFDPEGREVFRIEGDQHLTRFGWAVAATGQPGLFAVGESNGHGGTGPFPPATVDPAGFRKGRVHLFRWDGRGQPVRQATWVGEGVRDHLGFALAPAAALTGDGGARAGDVLAGALAWPFHPGTEQGRVYLLRPPR